MWAWLRMLSYISCNSECISDLNTWRTCLPYKPSIRFSTPSVHLRTHCCIPSYDFAHFWTLSVYFWTSSVHYGLHGASSVTCGTLLRLGGESWQRCLPSKLSIYIYLATSLILFHITIVTWSPTVSWVTYDMVIALYIHISQEALIICCGFAVNFNNFSS